MTTKLSNQESEEEEQEILFLQLDEEHHKDLCNDELFWYIALWIQGEGKRIQALQQDLQKLYEMK